VGSVSHPTRGRWSNWKQAVPPRFCTWVGPTWFLTWAGLGGGRRLCGLNGRRRSLELVSAVDDKDSWKACNIINTFIKKNFSQATTPTARDGIL